jgi:hypothetical protein
MLSETKSRSGRDVSGERRVESGGVGISGERNRSPVIFGQCSLSWIRA